MADPRKESRKDPRPWQFSEAIGGHILYVPSRDMIMLRDGRLFPRPQTLPRTHPLLQAAIWEVDSPGQYAAQPARPGVPEQVTPRSPPGSNASSDLASGLSAMSINARPQIIETIDRRTGVIARTIELAPTAQPDSVLRARGVHGYQVWLGSDDETESLDPSYKKRGAGFFKVGRVFMTLWPEPAGENGSRITSLLPPNQGRDVYLGSFGERFHTKVRRFVIIRASEKHCSALPISTYNERGVGKPGVKKSDHAIIHTTRTCPDPLPSERPVRGEEGMRPESIRVDPDDRAGKLDSMSRIDFAKVHTVHHNVKAKSFGVVHEKSLRPLLHQFNNVWQKDLHAPAPRDSSGPRAGPAISPEALQRWRQAQHDQGYTDTEMRRNLFRMLRGSSATAEQEEEEEEEEEDNEDGDDVEEEEEEDLYSPR
ncbi:hypothetical protein B0A48_15772 [Cryoendolithus antarcticus]|uniref:DUF6590 domain-containing protein n=1 Tax=Cryoendolithus antarcticus TaxID=1507870 RepID=A0A1V8SI15_9PEZI|nr:hypothetical protein B0A48_15772 [Cryoendolithus antarcticus]